MSEEHKRADPGPQYGTYGLPADGELARPHPEDWAAFLRMFCAGCTLTEREARDSC